jgi:hypothetical protein
MTDANEPMAPEAIFLRYKELAQAYWKAAAGDHLTGAARRYTGVSLSNNGELRELLALMLPEVEEAANVLDISFLYEGRAPAVIGGFPFRCNMFKAVYYRDGLAPSAEEVGDFLNECIGRARRGKSPRKPPSLVGTKVALGHGRSLLWRELKDFIKDRCGLEPDEYSLVPTAGLSRKDRLQQMLDAAGVAFLILTAEDEQPDGKYRARENVVHEVGLFQGRLGFSKAIILLEEGCEEFSNIAGLEQLRFQKGNVSSIFEEARRVLEREGLLKPSRS